MHLRNELRAGVCRSVFGEKNRKAKSKKRKPESEVTKLHKSLSIWAGKIWDKLGQSGTKRDRLGQSGTDLGGSGVLVVEPTLHRWER